jgi:hypothetical protein
MQTYYFIFLYHNLFCKTYSIHHITKLSSQTIRTLPLRYNRYNTTVFNESFTNGLLLKK